MPAVSIPSASASETAASVSAVSSAASAVSSAASAASAVSSTAASSVVVSASASVVSVVVSVASVLLPHAVSIAIVIAAVNKTANNFFITLLISAFSNAYLVSKTTKIYHGRFGKSIVYASFCYSYTCLKW